jgi:hypothetical protein
LKNPVLTLLPALFLVTLLAALPVALPHVEPLVSDDFTRAILTGAPDALGLGYRSWTGLGFLGILGLFFVRWDPWRRLVAAGIIVTGTVAFGLFPTYGAIQQGPTKEAAGVARSEGWDVVMWRLDMPSFAFYYGKITPLREPRPGEVVFTRITRLDRLEMPTEVLFQKGGIVLARALEPPGGGS